MAYAHVAAMLAFSEARCGVGHVEDSWMLPKIVFHPEDVHDLILGLEQLDK